MEKEDRENLQKPLLLLKKNLKLKKDRNQFPVFFMILITIICLQKYFPEYFRARLRLRLFSGCYYCHCLKNFREYH